MKEKPNILFVFADDWGYGDLGCYGHNELKTPCLDKLASEGTRFMQFHVASPVCSPSRCAVMTGNYPVRHGVHGHFARYDHNEQREMPNWLDPAVLTYPRLLKKAGYRTAHFGKWHLGGGGGMHGHPDAPLPSVYGFDDTRVWNGNGPTWSGTDPWPFALHNDMDEEFLLNSDSLAAEEAMKFMNSGDDPFYINLWLRAPHTPLVATEEQRAPYADTAEPKQTYYSVLTQADRQVGRVLDHLREIGKEDNTLVIFSSDNGPESVFPGREITRYCQGSTGGLRGRKRSLYEGGVRVPFIVRWPGMTPAGKIDFTSLLSAVDLYPTFCSICGVKVPVEKELDGVDMTSALEGKPFERDVPLMWEWRPANRNPDSTDCPMHALRHGEHVLLKNPDRNRVELYNVFEDYSQLNNLAPEQPDKVRMLEEQLDKWTQSLTGKNES